MVRRAITGMTLIASAMSGQWLRRLRNSERGPERSRIQARRIGSAVFHRSSSG